MGRAAPRLGMKALLTSLDVRSVGAAHKNQKRRGGLNQRFPSGFLVSQT